MRRVLAFARLVGTSLIVKRDGAASRVVMAAATKSCRQLTDVDFAFAAQAYVHSVIAHRNLSADPDPSQRPRIIDQLQDIVQIVACASRSIWSVSEQREFAATVPFQRR